MKQRKAWRIWIESYNNMACGPETEAWFQRHNRYQDALALNKVPSFSPGIRQSHQMDLVTAQEIEFESIHVFVTINVGRLVSKAS